MIAFFWRSPADRHWWRTVVAPTIGAVGLVGALVLVVQKFPLLTGSTSAVVANLSWLVAVVAVAGAGWAAWLRRHRPTVYTKLGTASEEAHHHNNSHHQAGEQALEIG